MNQSQDGWRNRGYLPHFDREGETQFITFRLFDSLPKHVAESLPPILTKSDTVKSLQRATLVDAALDKGYGSCSLRVPEVGRIIEEQVFRLNGIHYELHAWVIMPNHVHLLVTLSLNCTLCSVMKVLKGSTARAANAHLGSSGSFWYREYFDRYIRDQIHFETTVAYIENNPVKAGLCRTNADWRFSSAWWRGRAS